MNTINPVILGFQNLRDMIDDAIERNEIRFHYDAGHGWLYIPWRFVHNTIYDRSINHSYYDDHGVYFEEDCDMATFMRCRYGVFAYKHPAITSVYDGDTSRIRSLKRYEA